MIDGLVRREEAWKHDDDDDDDDCGGIYDLIYNSDTIHISR